MRRKKDKFKCVKIFPTFSWRTCFNCNHEFTREFGYRMSIGPYYGGKGREEFICSCCAPKQEIAEDLFTQNQERKMKRPNPPEGPPNRDVKHFE